MLKAMDQLLLLLLVQGCELSTSGRLYVHRHFGTVFQGINVTLSQPGCASSFAAEHMSPFVLVIMLGAPQHGQAICS